MIIQDQIGHKFKLTKSPQRIVSIVPSQTELLYTLGLDNEVVGITKFCIHPKVWFKSKNRVGGTKNVNFDKIEALNPDLIIANKEENTKDQIEYLQTLYPVYTSDILDLNHSLSMINDIGTLTNCKKAAQEISATISRNFNQLKKVEGEGKTVLYLIWRQPFMSVGSDTFINDLLSKCGFINVLFNKNRYPEVTEAEITRLNPSYIFLSSEPYPFKEKHIEELQVLCPNTTIILVDGEYFSWYGSRLLEAPNYFNGLINKLS